MRTRSDGPSLVESDPLETPSALSERFAGAGYLFFRDVLDHRTVGAAADEVTRELRRQGVVGSRWDQQDTRSPGWSGSPATDLDEAALYGGTAHRDLAGSEQLRGLLVHLFGVAVFVYRHVILRYALPGDDIHLTPAHQDLRFIGPNDDFRTVWIPLIDVPIGAGGLSLVAGSHRSGVKEHVPVRSESSAYRGRKRLGIPQEAVDGPWCTADYRVGDVLVFDCRTIHRALPNRSATVRLSLDVRAQPATTTRSWDSQRTVPEVIGYRERVRELVTSTGGSPELFERVVTAMIEDGLDADPATVATVAARLEGCPAPPGAGR